MRRLLLALGLTAALAAPARAATGVVFQGQGANGASAAPTHAFSTAVGAGSVLVLLIQDRTDETTTISSVTDTSSNTWAPLSYVPFDHTGGTVQRTWIYVCQSAAAGTPTVTINFSGSISSTYAAVEITGATTSGQPTDQDTTPPVGSGVTITSDALNITTSGTTIALATTTGAVTASAPTSGYTLLTTAGNSRVFLWTKPSTAGNPETFSATIGSTAWLVHMINIGESGGGGGSVRPIGLLTKGV